MQFKQETIVLKEGNGHCTSQDEHVWVEDMSSNRVTVFPPTHTVTRICFLCGRLELVKTYKDCHDPFSFKNIKKRFGG